jgi:hypothetical protein
MSLPEMEWVDSSNIEAVGYDDDARRLYIQFSSGNTYSYEGVPPETHQELMAAVSKGSYFNREIKPNYPAAPV